METININKKQPVIRNGSGISAYDKAYYQNYAKQKTKEKKLCEACNIEISYYCMSKHSRTKRHLKNIEQI